MKRILKNAIQCNHCKKIIVSTNTHDFVTCDCGRCSVDGGTDYLRRCFTDSLDDFTELSEYEAGSEDEEENDDESPLPFPQN